MKKILLMMFMMPIMVFATCKEGYEEIDGVCKPINACNPIENEPDKAGNTYTKSLRCDPEYKNSVKYTGEEEVVLDNEVCKITCSEEVIFAIDPVKKVLAGTSFSYPIYTSGIRKCRAVYNYVNYETKIKEYVNSNNTAQIKRLQEQKLSCDEFTTEGSVYEKRYTFDGKVEAEIETSESNKKIEYVYKQMGDYDNVVEKNEVLYNSCNLNNANKCAGGDYTMASWIQTVSVTGKYTMPDVYLEKYTGEVKEKSVENTCNAKDRFFTSFKEETRLESGEGETKDYGYEMKITAEGLNNDLVTSDIWNLNVTCNYQVKNVIFPQENCIGNNCSEIYDKYGKTAFEYRPVDLSNPFPSGKIPANWLGKVNIITDTRNNLSTLRKFEITLDRSGINKLRTYNDTHSYDTFNVDEMEKSNLIKDNIEIFDRK